VLIAQVFFFLLEPGYTQKHKVTDASDHRKLIPTHRIYSNTAGVGDYVADPGPVLRGGANRTLAFPPRVQLAPPLFSETLGGGLN